jgi:hypothetical protein
MARKKNIAVPGEWEPPKPLPKATLLDHDETGLMLNANGEYFQRPRKSKDQSQDSDPDPDQHDYYRRPRLTSP